MSRRRPGRHDLPADDVGPEDGADPKAFHDRRGRHAAARHDGCIIAPSRKALQLCGQVRDALTVILAGCRDPVLHGLTVVAVEPAPHTGRLMVTVAGPRPADVTDPAPRAAEHLARAAGLLRAEVAAAVSRRNAPELAFRVA